MSLLQLVGYGAQDIYYIRGERHEPSGTVNFSRISNFELLPPLNTIPKEIQEEIKKVYELKLLARESLQCWKSRQKDVCSELRSLPESSGFAGGIDYLKAFERFQEWQGD